MSLSPRSSKKVNKLYFCSYIRNLPDENLVILLITLKVVIRVIIHNCRTFRPFNQLSTERREHATSTAGRVLWGRSMVWDRRTPSGRLGIMRVRLARHRQAESPSKPARHQDELAG
jgi:hypothetical protein